MKKLLILPILLLAFACNHEINQGPREINWDRDICINCLMGLADQKYSVQSINKHEEVIWFEEIGRFMQPGGFNQQGLPLVSSSGVYDQFMGEITLNALI